jgi:rod shape-determining protein MreC
MRTLVVLSCLALAVVTLYAREGSSGPVHTLRFAVQTAAAPFAKAGSWLCSPFGSAAQALRNATASSETLDALVAENAALTAQLAELDEYRSENESLRALLGLSLAYGMDGVGALVIGTSADDWTDAVVVDKGSSAGVELYMPVVDANGAVGQVTAVAADSATVTLFSDPGSQVSVLLQGSRATGILEGSVDGSLHLSYVSTSTSVDVGELVVTSGLGATYPRGLLVGTVASVSSSPSDLYYDIVVTPVADRSTLEEVVVVTSFESATAEVAAENLLTSGSYEPTADASADEASQGGI